MDNNKYEELTSKLEKAGVEITRNALYVKGTKKKKDCSVLFDGEGISEREFLDEVGRRIDAKQKEAMEKYDAPQGFENSHIWKTVVHPSLSALERVGESDKKIFKRIAFARDKINNTLILCVNIHDNEWRAVQMSTSKTMDISKLSSLLAQTESVSGKYKSYYDELLAIEKAPFKAAVSKYRNHKLHGTEELVEFISEHYPCSMLACSYLKIMLEQVKTVIIDNNGDEKETTILVPSHAIAAQGESYLSYSPIRHLVEQAPLLAACPDFVIPMPKTITNDPNVPAFKYIDLETLPVKGACPAWVELFSRYTEDEAKVLRAFLWSLFVADNRSRQLLYIYDPFGFSAKSVMQNAVASAIGDDQVGALQKDSMSNQFGLAKIWNKRVVFIGDNKNPNLVRSEKMHMALGGDLAEIEYKQAASFFARLNVKVIASGNTQLHIDPSAQHERTRLIVLKPKVTEDILRKIAVTDNKGNVIYDDLGRPQLVGDPSFETALCNEFRNMLWQAREDYKELCPTDGNIILPESVQRNVDDCNDDLLDTIDAIIQERFVIDVDNPETFMTAHELREEFRSYASSDRELTFDMFKDHLAKRYKVQLGYNKMAWKTCGTKNPVYNGIKAKST